MRCLTIEECNRWRDARSRRREWKRQITCSSPFDRLPWFSEVLVEQLMPFDEALLIVAVVLNASRTETFRRAAGESRSVGDAPGHLFQNDPDGLRAILAAALADTVDVRLLLSPPRHAIIADHDEFTTVFSESSGKIANVRRVLEQGKISMQDWYVARPPKPGDFGEVK